jgi:hypothetical protein
MLNTLTSFVLAPAAQLVSRSLLSFLFQAFEVPTDVLT